MGETVIERDRARGKEGMEREGGEGEGDGE